MADPRIIDVSLDERTIAWRSADIEQERRIAIFDLLESTRVGAGGEIQLTDGIAALMKYEAVDAFRFQTR